MSANGISILRICDLCSKVGLSKSTIYSMIAKGEFPKQHLIHPRRRAVGWFAHEIDSWLVAMRGDQDAI